MVAQQQSDFGLEEFIAKHRLNVAETSVGKLRKLTLRPSEQTPRESFTIRTQVMLFYIIDHNLYEDPVVEVILRRDSVLGAQFRLRPDINPSSTIICKEQITGYHLSYDWIRIGTQGIDYIKGFGQFLAVGDNQSDSYKLGGEDVQVSYSVGSLRSSTLRYITLGLPECSGNIKGDDRYDFYESHVQCSISTDEMSHVVSRSIGNTTVNLRVPKAITREQLKELEKLVNSPTGWLELPRRVPILEYSTQSP